MDENNFCRGKGLCLKNGHTQRAVNKNYSTSKGVLQQFLNQYAKNCWLLPNNSNCWLLPNGEPWLVP